MNTATERLPPKQERFVAEYLVDLNGTQAAIRAGYSRRSANEQAARLLANANVRAAVERAKAARLKKLGIDADMVLERIRRVLVGDVRKLFDERGNPRPIHELGEEEAALIASYEVVVKNARAGDNHQDEVLKVRIVDRAKYVEMAARHLGMLRDRVEVDLPQLQAVFDRLEEGRRRVAAARQASPLPSGEETSRGNAPRDS